MNFHHMISDKVIVKSNYLNNALCSYFWNLLIIALVSLFNCIHYDWPIILFKIFLCEFHCLVESFNSNLYNFWVSYIILNCLDNCWKDQISVFSAYWIHIDFFTNVSKSYDWCLSKVKILIINIWTQSLNNFHPSLLRKLNLSYSCNTPSSTSSYIFIRSSECI